MPCSLADIRAALQGTLPLTAEDGEGRVAAVSAILRARRDEAELLFIRRARRRGDPWSGHMAWPGGKRELADDSLVACAIRETREEIGLDLAAAGELVGALRPYVRESPGIGGLRAVYPFVFALDRDAAHVREPAPLDGNEVEEAVWIPLSYFSDWLSRRPWKWMAGWLPSTPPAYRYHGRVIWGLTLWMLSDLLERLKATGRRG